MIPQPFLAPSLEVKGKGMGERRTLPDMSKPSCDKLSFNVDSAI